MMRYDYLNLHIETVIMDMTGTKQIPILHVCDLDENEPKEFLAYKHLLQVCSMDEGEPESVIINIWRRAKKKAFKKS